jgi:EmrB/QacA subfamily drug resistance transporter
VAIVYVVTMFVNILDSTIVTVVLPTLAREFNAGTESIDWVVTGYLLSLAVWIPASGWIGDRIGTKRTFLFAILVFTGGSVLCGLATSLVQLVVFRIIQGVGGGMLTPIGFAMLMRTFPPEERANASKILIVPTAMAPASGPIIGGFLTDWLDWRWVFFVNLPICLAAFGFGLVFLREHREARPGRFDLPGFVLSAAGLAAILYALSRGPGHGWGSPVVLASGLGGLVCFALLVPIELRQHLPMLQLRLLTDRLFRTVMLVSACATGAFLGTLFAMPLFLQQVRGTSALESGLTTFPEAVGVMSLAQLSGRLYPRVGPRRLMVAGLLGLAFFLLLLTRVDTGTNLWVVRLLMFAVGGSMSFVFIPLQASAFARIPSSDTGRASAIYNTQRQMSSALGVAVLATILAARLPAGGATGAGPFLDQQVGAFHDVFVVGAVIALLGAAVALSVRDADAEGTMRARQSGEPAAAG